MRRFIQKLSLISDAPHFGGAERYLVDMAQAAVRRGIEPTILWYRRPDSDPDVFATSACNDIRVEVREPECIDRMMRLAVTAQEWLRRERPDGLIINACGRRRFWLMPWLAWQAGIPSVWVHQMVDETDHRRLPARWLGGRVEGPGWWRIPQTLRHRLAASAATSVVTLNAEDRERVVRWHGVHRDHIRVVPHGVDCERFRFDLIGRKHLRHQWATHVNRAGRPLIVGSAGRLSHEKGMDLLIQATGILRKKGIPIQTVIAGQGSERDALKRLAERLGVSEAVTFLSFVEDMPAFYSALDVFLLASRTESFGLALAEAMACERPVIGTPTSGASRQIRHRHCGWQLNDFSPKEIAEAIETLAGDRALARQLGINGRDSVVRHFSIDLTLERTLRALRGSAAERSRLRWPGMNEWPFAAMSTEDLA